MDRDPGDEAFAALLSKALAGGVGAQLPRKKLTFDENTPLDRLAIDASLLPCEPLEWIWPGRVAAGHVAAVIGPRGSGKSAVIADMIGRITSGKPWPDDPFETPQKPGSVLYITAEDDLVTQFMPRLRAAGAYLKKVRVISYPRSTLKERRSFGAPDVEQWELAASKMPGLRLIVIDSLARVLGRSNDRFLLDVEDFLGSLVELARARRVAIVITNATDKGSNGKGAPRSVDVIPYLCANARMVWETEVDPERPGCKWFVPRQAGLDLDPGGLEFKVDPRKKEVVWNRDPLRIYAGGVRDSPARAKNKVERALPWLAQYLVEGPLPVRQILQDGLLAGHNARALNHAKRLLDVVSHKSTLRFDGHWSWELPLEKADEPPPPARHWWAGPESAAEVAKMTEDDVEANLTPSPRCEGGSGRGAAVPLAHGDCLAPPLPIPPPQRGEGTGTAAVALDREDAKMTGSHQEPVEDAKVTAPELRCVAAPTARRPADAGESNVTPSRRFGDASGTEAGEPSAHGDCLAPPLATPPPQQAEGTGTAAGAIAREDLKVTDSHEEAVNDAKVTERKFVVGGVTFYFPIHEEIGSPGELSPQGHEDAKVTGSHQEPAEDTEAFSRHPSPFTHHAPPDLSPRGQEDANVASHDPPLSTHHAPPGLPPGGSEDAKMTGSAKSKESADSNKQSPSEAERQAALAQWRSVTFEASDGPRFKKPAPPPIDRPKPQHLIDLEARSIEAGIPGPFFWWDDPVAGPTPESLGPPSERGNSSAPNS